MNTTHLILTLMGFALLLPVNLTAQTPLTPSETLVPTELETGETVHRFGERIAANGDWVVLGPRYPDSSGLRFQGLGLDEVHISGRSIPPPDGATRHDGFRIAPTPGSLAP